MARSRNFAALLLAPLLVALATSAALAQNYPNKPVRLVLPYAPGGIIDYVGRTLAQHLSEPLGQPVVAENRPGAGGIAGTDTVARSAPDGYTIVIMDPAIVINPTLQPTMPYDLFKQLTTVSIVSSSPEVLVVAPQLAVKTLTRPDRLRQGQSRQTQFRVRRHRHHAASRRRIVQAARRHRRHARALSRHRRSHIPT